jgi:hypothetical protein
MVVKSLSLFQKFFIFLGLFFSVEFEKGHLQGHFVPPYPQPYRSEISNLKECLHAGRAFLDPELTQKFASQPTLFILSRLATLP